MKETEDTQFSIIVICGTKPNRKWEEGEPRNERQRLPKCSKSNTKYSMWERHPWIALQNISPETLKL